MRPAEDDSWTRADDIRFAYETLPASHPLFTARSFVMLLLAGAVELQPLRALVTPESLESWGDFHEAVDRVRAIDDVGFGHKIFFATDDPEVAWVVLLDRHHGDSGNPDDREHPIPGFVSMVRRRDRTGWLVHGIGSWIEPEDLPHH